MLVAIKGKLCPASQWWYIIQSISRRLILLNPFRAPTIMVMSGISSWIIHQGNLVTRRVSSSYPSYISSVSSSVPNMISSSILYV